MDTDKRIVVTDTPIDRCSHEHCDPLYAYGYPRSTVSYADGHAHSNLNAYAYNHASANPFRRHPK